MTIYHTKNEAVQFDGLMSCPIQVYRPTKQLNKTMYSQYVAFQKGKIRIDPDLNCSVV